MKKLNQFARDIRVATSGSNTMLHNAAGRMSRDSKIARQVAGDKMKSAGSKVRSKLPW